MHSSPQTMATAIKRPTLHTFPPCPQGDLAFRPISYTPWPVDEAYEGERVRIPVGEVKQRTPRLAMHEHALHAGRVAHEVAARGRLFTRVQWVPLHRGLGCGAFTTMATIRQTSHPPNLFVPVRWRVRARRTFVFAHTLPVASDIVVVTLPRPLGVVLEYDERFKRTTVVDLVEGTYADQRRRVGGGGSCRSINSSSGSSCAGCN